MFAASGSRITAAISPGNRAKAASSAARVVVGHDRRQGRELVRNAGAPGDPERGEPEPAATRNESAWPW